MLFGGFVPIAPKESTNQEGEEEEKTPLEIQDNGMELLLTNKSMILDVTVGSIKYGPELQTASYFPSGGYKMSHNSQIFAFGLTLPVSNVTTGMAALSGEQADGKKKENVAAYGSVSHKKTLHLFKPGESKWIEASE